MFLLYEISVTCADHYSIKPICLQGLEIKKRSHYNHLFGFMQTNEIIRHGVVPQGLHGAPSQVHHADFLYHNHVQEYRRDQAKISLLAHLNNPENIAPSEPGIICGDGRYEDINGRFARFGADGGYILGLLSLNHTRKLGLSPAQIVNTVIAASGARISIHSDEKAEDANDPSIIGCSHLAKATDPALAERHYGVNPREVVDAISYMKFLAAAQPERVEMRVLRGEHNEVGLIINEGTAWKIRHGANGTQWFMWGEVHDDLRVEELYPAIEGILPVLRAAGITKADYKETLLLQTLATARGIAHGKPVFRVNLDHPEHKIEPAGFIG